MKITAIETIRHKRWTNFLWVRVQTDEGLVGLGETFRHPEPIETYIHAHLADYLLGQDPSDLNRHAHAMHTSGGLRFLGYPTRSVEIRANSAVDIALWDLKGRATGQSIAQLLGGPVRAQIPIYNTCAGPGYNWTAGLHRARMADEAGDDSPSDAVPDDLELQNSDPAGLARSLLGDGIAAMKIWPFDVAAEASGGMRISSAQMDDALSKIAAIREAVGNEVDVLVEYHGLWKPAVARQILRETDAFKPFWHEDIIDMTDIGNLVELRQRSTSPFAGSESHGTVPWFRDALAARAIDYAHFDVGWVGGLSQAQKIAHLCDAHEVMIAPHDCTGPVVWAVNLQLALAMPAAVILESVRAYYQGVYRQMATGLPVIETGMARAPESVARSGGHGCALAQRLLDDPDRLVRVSKV